MTKIILLHGIFIPKQQLIPLAKFLTKNNYQVSNIGYPSTKKRVKDLASDLKATIQAEIDQSDDVVHFVTFSMGGLMIRELLPQLSIPQAGRLVMIAPPNRGSPLASIALKIPLVRSIYGPALKDCADPQGINQKITLETGIIAGENQKLNLANLIFKEANDGDVAVESTKLKGAKAHITLNFSHSFGPLNKTVQEETLCFLNNGCFSREE